MLKTRTFELSERDRGFIAFALYGVFVRQTVMRERVLEIAERIDAKQFLEAHIRETNEIRGYYHCAKHKYNPPPGSRQLLCPHCVE